MGTVWIRIEGKMLSYIQKKQEYFRYRFDTIQDKAETPDRLKC